jgi:hypothetical protein
MKQFIITYHAPVDAAWRTAESTPEEMEVGMKAWMDWAERCGSKLVDFGTPLGNGFDIKPGGRVGNSESTIIGYSIMEADNMEEARDLCLEHPHLDWNEACQIVIHESLPVPGS